VILLAEERQRLRPLKVQPHELALRFPVLVGPRAAVIHDGQSYTMPPEAAGLVGMLHLYPDRVAIVAGRYEATHPRSLPPPLMHGEGPTSRAGDNAPDWTPPALAGTGLPYARA
jgi:hypothetical protein